MRCLVKEKCWDELADDLSLSCGAHLLAHLLQLALFFGPCALFVPLILAGVCPLALSLSVGSLSAYSGVGLPLFCFVSVVVCLVSFPVCLPASRPFHSNYTPNCITARCLQAQSLVNVIGASVSLCDTCLELSVQFALIYTYLRLLSLAE